MLDCPPTSTTSTRCRNTISTTWPLLGCTTSLETMPQLKWWALRLSTINPVCLFELPAVLSWVAPINPNIQRLRMTRGSVPLISADASFFYLSSPRLFMRSETTHIPSCTCWLCRVSTPPATRRLSGRATRSVLLLPLPLSRHATPH